MSAGDAVAYIRRPRWTGERAPVDAEGLRHLIVLYMLTVVMVIVVSGVIWPLILSATGGAMPANANDELINGSPGQLVLYGIVLAPLIEEALFRSWLGRPRAVLAGLPLVASLVAVMFALGHAGSGMVGVVVAAALGFVSVAAAMRAFSVSPETAAAARERLFPAAFWGSAVAFALLHVTNFTDDTLGWPWLALAVLPQGLVGLVLGYVRMRFGLVPAIFYHASYNALFLSIALLAAGLAEAPPPA